MQDAEPYDPERAQRLIVSLRVENRQLKARLRGTDRLTDQGLPASWHKKFADLRRENGKFRTERNQARAELAALRAELGAGK